MATLKQRLHRKNSSGTYDTIHLETGADCITGTLAVSHGGTGATTAANARTNLGAAASSHNHSAANITSGTLPLARGGTGLNGSPSMLVNLASTAAASILASKPRPGVTGTLPVNRGGTGRATLTSGYFLRGNGTGAVTMSSVDDVKELLGIVEIVQTVSITLGHYSYGDASTYTLKQSVKYIKVVGGYRRPNNADTIAMPEVTITAGSNAVCASYYLQSGTVAWGEYSAVVALGSDGKTISVSGGVTYNGACPNVFDTGNVTAYA